MHGLQHFGEIQAEFGARTDGAAPAPCAAAGQLGADPKEWGCTQGFAGLDDAIHFIGLFDHHHGLVSKPPGQDRRLDVTAVLVAVADQQGLRILGE